MTSHHYNNKGFTIIETLVAITILMIAIVGPLTIAHKGLLAAVYARDQVAASYLAQDAMEYIKNVRDNNLLANEGDWLEGMGECAGTALLPKYCTVDTIDGNPATTANGISVSQNLTTCMNGACRVYVNEIGFGHDDTSTPTHYYRYFYIVPSSGGAPETETGNNTQAKIIVIVTWKTGGIVNQVMYENEIFNVIRG